MSIKVGNQECHIIEHPSGRLPVFSNLGKLNTNNYQAFLEISMLSQDEKKPIVGFDNKSNNNIIIWNYQYLLQVERHSLYEQLELLSQYYDQLASVEETVETTISDSEHSKN
ncbi:CesT family type III secretion system chaperone [Vibrio harveyi]|uniref:CesT family type III secretion system chaperone n=1 Tax=Vibrio harveyi TaxID=669 RepID=UPI00237F8497|nr:CesT family type III secretion system chaperone [Vibrio harveyi]